MARVAGARNAQFEERRNALIEKAKERLSLQDGQNPSFRELALAAGVSVATLRHYFGDRESLIKAVFAHYLQSGQRHLERTRAPDPVEVDLETSLRDVLQRLVRGWTSGTIGSLHRIGLAEGCVIGEPLSTISSMCSNRHCNRSRLDCRAIARAGRSSSATHGMRR